MHSQEMMNFKKLFEIVSTELSERNWNWNRNRIIVVFQLIVAFIRTWYIIHNTYMLKTK